MADRSPELVIVGREELTPIPPRPTPRHPPRQRPQPRPRRSDILARTRDIVAANMTELLDRAEDPARMNRLTIARMEDMLAEVRASVTRTLAEQDGMRRRVADLAALRADWAEKAEFALGKGREDLARAALAEKQKASDLAERLRAGIADLAIVLKAADGDIARLEAKLRDACARQKEIVAQLEKARHAARLRERADESRIDAALLRWEGLEGRVDAGNGQAELRDPASVLETEIATLRLMERVDAELETMKAARSARH